MPRCAALSHLDSPPSFDLPSFDSDARRGCAARAQEASADGTVAKRSVKYIAALLSGIWVVSPGWAQACAAAGQVVDEAPFELKDRVRGQARALACTSP